MLIYNQWLTFLRQDACQKSCLDIFNSLSELELRQKYEMESLPNIYEFLYSPQNFPQEIPIFAGLLTE